MNEMTLEQVRDALRDHDDVVYDANLRLVPSLDELADAIDAHLASQPAEQPRGDGYSEWLILEFVREWEAMDHDTRRRYEDCIRGLLLLLPETNQALPHRDNDPTDPGGPHPLAGIPAQPKPEQAVACGCPCEPSGSDGLRCPGRDGKLLCDPSHKPEQAVGDGVAWIGGTSLTRVNPAQMVRIAQNYARLDADHAYTKVPNFVPHDWVVAAMCAAYDAGRQNIIDGTHTEGFTPEAIESVRHIFTPRPAVAMPSINAQDTDVRIQPKGWRLIHETPTDEILDVLRWHLNEACQGPPFFPEIVFNALLSALPDPNPYQIEAAPAVATPAEVTDEQRFVSVQALESLAHHFDDGGWRTGADYVNAMMEAATQVRALTAQCQVRKDGQGVGNAAALMLRKITERVEHFQRVGNAGGHYIDGRRHEAQFILDTCNAALASPSAGAVVPEDTAILDWLCKQHVEVRTPLLHGSRLAFVTAPKLDVEGIDDDVPSFLRDEARKAMLAAATEVPGHE